VSSGHSLGRQDAMLVLLRHGTGVVRMRYWYRWNTVSDIRIWCWSHLGRSVSVSIIRRQEALLWPFVCGLPYSDAWDVDKM